MATRDLEVILGALVDALRHQDPERIGQLLAPGVVWEGRHPGTRCDGRDQVMDVLRHRFAAAPLAVLALEAIEGSEAVAIGLRGPGFNDTLGDVETVGQSYLVFRLRDGKVVHWRDYRTREDALAAAGATDPAWT